MRPTRPARGRRRSSWATASASLTGYANGGTVGAVYRFTGANGASVNLGLENYATGTWAPVSTFGGISLSAIEHATIHATTAAAAAAGAAGLVGISFAGAGADARNVILTKTDAYISSSDVVSAAAVSLTATSTGTSITAEVAGIAAAISVGLGAGAFAIGIAVAENFIGWDPHPTAATTYDTNSAPASVTTNQTVKILEGAAKGDVYKYIGAAALISPNLKTQDYTDASKWQQVGTTAAGETKAYITNSSLVGRDDAHADGDVGRDDHRDRRSRERRAGGRRDRGRGCRRRRLRRQPDRAGDAGVHQRQPRHRHQVAGDGTDAIALSATDNSGITATGGAAAVAAAIGFVGSFSAAIAVAIARNDIQADVEAYISSATVGTTSGLTRLQATNTASVSAVSATAALSVSLSGSLSGAGAFEDVSVTSTTKAYVSGGTLTLGGALQLDATDTSTATATAQTVSVSIAFVGFAARRLDRERHRQPDDAGVDQLRDRVRDLRQRDRHRARQVHRHARRAWPSARR